jgi:hypothetical protein
MPNFYSKHLNATLKEFVEAQIGESPREQLQLFEELALARTMALRLVKLYGVSVGTDAEANATALMKDALSFVVDVCNKAAKVDAAGKDKLSVHNLNHAVLQVTRILYEVLGGEHDQLAKEIELRINRELKIVADNTESEASGTEITRDVLDGMSVVAKRELLLSIRGEGEPYEGNGNGKNGNGKRK